MSKASQKALQRKAKAISKQEEKQYYEQARSWESEVYRSARGRARVWALFAIISTLLSMACVGTLMAIIPLKETVPYVIEVDRASGLVEVKRSIHEVGISESEAITKYFIVEYLNAREAYLYDRAQIDYVKVQKMSSSNIAATHYEWFQPSNESSPLNQFGKHGTVEIVVRHISFIDKDTASIPIKRIEKRRGSIKETYEIVTLSFEYLQDPATEQDRLINPLGFQVTAYRKDAQLARN